MKRKIDDTGRLVIPKEIRDELRIENGDDVEIQLIDNKIILTNPNDIDYKKIVYKALTLLLPYVEGTYDITFETIETVYKILLQGVNDEEC